MLAGMEELRNPLASELQWRSVAHNVTTAEVWLGRDRLASACTRLCVFRTRATAIIGWQEASDMSLPIDLGVINAWDALQLLSRFTLLVLTLTSIYVSYLVALQVFRTGALSLSTLASDTRHALRTLSAVVCTAQRAVRCEAWHALAGNVLWLLEAWADGTRVRSKDNVHHKDDEVFPLNPSTHDVNQDVDHVEDGLGRDDFAPLPPPSHHT